MRQLGLTEQQIPDFVDAYNWVKYFPPKGQEHIKKFGVHVDHSRSFITTDLNPYYDSFIRWQFTLLKERGYIKYGQTSCFLLPSGDYVAVEMKND